jgi:hypothetical protein
MTPLRRRRGVIGLVFLLVMTHLCLPFFNGWSKENLWILGADAVIIGLIFFREYVIDGLSWWRRHKHDNIDREVFKFLGDKELDDKKISEGMGKKEKEVRCSLERLNIQHLVEQHPDGTWHRIFRYISR